jgi:AsmA protein
MKSALKWTAVVVLALVVVVIGALLVIPNFIDANNYKPELEKYVLEATGRPLSVGGDVRLSLFPWAGVSFSDLRLGNTPAFDEKDFLTVKSFDVRVKLWPLLSKQVEVERWVVNEPRLSLVTNKDGRVNWDFAARPAQAKPSVETEAATETGMPISSLLIGELGIQNGQILMIDHGKGSRQEIAGLNVALRDVSFDRPVRLTLSATVNQKPIAAEGRFGPVGKNPGQGAVPLELTADAFAQLKLKIKGTVENFLVAPLARIEVEVAEFSPRRLLAEIGQSLPPTADAKVLERFSLKASVNADAKAVAVSDAVMALDDSKLTFTAKAAEFVKPDITFDLHLDQINIDRYLPPKSKTGAGPPPTGQPAGRPPQKTDYTPLRKWVLNGNAKIGQLTVAQAQAEDVNMKITAKDGVLSLDPFAMKLYQGTAAGKAAVNLKGEMPVTESQLNLDRVQVNPLLKDVADKDFLEGTAQARVTLSTSGEDPARIKQNLNGRGNLVLNDGAIVGVDLANMVRNVKAAFSGEGKSGAKPRTDFAELLVPFTIERGVFHTPEAVLKSPLLRLQASGQADLVKETLDFRIDPKVVGTLKGQGDDKDRAGLGVPVLVSGTFASPAFRPDLEGLAKDRLKQALTPPAGGAAPIKDKAGELIKGLLPGKK